MICISIAQESRRFALVDMANAAKQCDLLEVRLDRFDKAPDVSELLAHKPKPVIFSCRRKEDGGDWEGSEEERLALLRQCIVSKADYVEIELDAADQIRKFPPAKRVISYTNWRETPANIGEIYAQAQTKNPDVIKLMTLARSPEEAWPLLQILAKPALPTVVVGVGKPGIMLSVLGKKIGAPWTYAALEKGMEAYPGQPTINDLNQVYHYGSIERSTRLIGVTGFGRREVVSAAALNSGLAHLQLNTRCLPLGVGSIALFRKIVDAVKLAGLVVGEEHREILMGIATELDATAKEAHAADVLVSRDRTWHAYNTLGQAVVAALEGTLRNQAISAAEPLTGRMVMIVGVNPTARAVAAEVKKRKGVVIVASHNRDSALQLAQSLESRHVQFEALYTTMHEILIMCDEEKEHAKGKTHAAETGIHAGYLRSGMTVMDLTTMQKSSLLGEAQARGCHVVFPRKILREQLAGQLHLLTGKQAPAEVLDKPLLDMLEEED